MIPLRAHVGRRVAVLSLTGAGLTAARALAAGGAEVTVWDGDETRRAHAQDLGLAVEDPTARDWSDMAALVVGDAALLSEDPAPRLIDLARALDLLVISAEAVLARGYADAPVRFAAGLGRQAPAALDLAGHLLRSAGQAVIGPAVPDRMAPVSTRPVVLGAFEAVPAAAPQALCLLDGAGRTDELRAGVDAADGPVVLSADDPAVRRLSVSGRRRAVLASGRSTLSRGVFVSAGRLFDAQDGPARRIADLPDLPGCAHASRLAVAAGYALARSLGLRIEDAPGALETYPGAPGHGRVLGRLGPLALSDWSSAAEPRAVCDALRQAGPVVWLAGPSVDPKLAALLDAAGLAPANIVLTGDRRRARRKLARLCPVHVERDPTAALARAIHDGLKAGPKAGIILAPGGPCAGGLADQFAAALGGLVRQARQGDAA